MTRVLCAFEWCPGRMQSANSLNRTLGPGRVTGRASDATPVCQVSDVEEDGLAATLEDDVQAVDDPAVGLLAAGDQGTPTLRWDERQDRVRLVGGLVLEVEPRLGVVQHPTSVDSDGEVRRLHLLALEGDLAGLDGLEPVDASVVRAGAPPAGEVRVERQIAGVTRVVEAAVRVGLPDLDHGVRHHVAGAIEDATFDADALAGRVAGGHDVVDVAEQGRREERADRLGGSDAEGWLGAHRPASPIGPVSSGAGHFSSNGVASGPCSTMSQR